MEIIRTYAAITWTWIVAHPEIPVFVLLYLFWNVKPRTPPANPRLRALWLVLERLSFLAWHRWGGPLKRFGIVYPPLPEIPEKEPITDVPRE